MSLYDPEIVSVSPITACLCIQVFNAMWWQKMEKKLNTTFVYINLIPTNSEVKLCLHQIRECLEPGYGLDDREFESRKGLLIFLFTTASRPALRPTQPPIQWVPGALSVGVKGSEREADAHPHLVLRSRMWGAIPPLQYAFMLWCTVKSTGTISAFTFQRMFSVTFKYRNYVNEIGIYAMCTLPESIFNTRRASVCSSLTFY
jgi:hypothetical protein